MNAEPQAEVAVPVSRPGGLVGWVRPTIRYWFEVEVHVYALSVAAAVLLSFFPFMIVMMSLCRYVLVWPEAVKAIELALADFFPKDLYVYISRNLTSAVESRPQQLTSLFLLMITANAVFVPFEVALNKAWGVRKNRTYILNQLVCLGLIFVCGGLALASFALTAVNREFVKSATWLPAWIGLGVFKIAAIPMSILSLALMYWLLPNRKVRFASILPTAVLVGLSLEGLKYLNLTFWPYLKTHLISEYGPFYISVSIVLWSFLAAMVILAGAERSARRARGRAQDPTLFVQ